MKFNYLCWIIPGYFSALTFMLCFIIVVFPVPLLCHSCPTCHLEQRDCDGDGSMKVLSCHTEDNTVCYQTVHNFSMFIIIIMISLCVTIFSFLTIKHYKDEKRKNYITVSDTDL